MIKLFSILFAVLVGVSAAAQGQPSLSEQASACQTLVDIPNLTIFSARLVEARGSTPEYCHVKGIISPAITYHLQLPLPRDWNGRFLNWGDGGKDGDLDFADHRVAQGYAVANTNTGHDAGAEPGASFGFNNRQAEIDFGYRAVHLMVKTAKTAIQAYYGRNPDYSYHEGCSTGGRQGLMEAQRFPYDFDGIVAGAPVNFYQELNLTHVWMLQRIFRDNFSGNLAFDADGDGSPESLRKLEILRKAVLDKCDQYDGIRDGIVDDPLSCDFDVEVDLAAMKCQNHVDGETCFTAPQMQTLKDFYGGARDSRGVKVLKGLALGSEFGWERYIPHAGNSLFPSSLANANNHAAYLFYQTDPGVPVPDPTNLSYLPDRKSHLPEWAWWEFDIDDLTGGQGDFMKSITNATDPDLTRFLIKNGGKLILYHGWGDVAAHPEPTLDYYKEVVKTTFGGDIEAARKHTRIFMVPGMAHCGGGPGPNDWDKLAPLVEWVEKGEVPNHLVVTHSTAGVVENERKVCSYPERAVYVGPAAGAHQRANWREENFACHPAED